MIEDLEAYRDEFPVVGKKAYLISAALGPVSRRSQLHLAEYMDAWATKGAPDPLWSEDIFPRMASVKRSFAALVGADPDELAITLNVSLSLSAVMSCLRFTPERNRIVLSELDFPTDGHVALAQRARGAEVVFVRAPDGLTVPAEAYAEAIDERTAFVIVNRVLFRSSTIVDATAVCAMAREAGAWSVVDDYHGAGVVPVDVHELGCDFYTAGVMKWLCGGPGMAFLYARRDRWPALEPTMTGWLAAADPFAFDPERRELHPTARRLESGSPAAPMPFIAQGGLDVIAEVGVERIRERIVELTSYVVERADGAGIPVRAVRDARARGGTVNLTVGPDAGRLTGALLERDVCVDHRGDGIRVSPHFFNTHADVDRLFDELAGLR